MHAQPTILWGHVHSITLIEDLKYSQVGGISSEQGFRKKASGIGASFGPAP